MARSLSIKSYDPEYIFGMMRSGVEEVVLDGETVRIKSNRLKTFCGKGIVCVECGIAGSHFRKERSHPSDLNPHLSLYAMRATGLVEILMTADHIVPKSKGGIDGLSNLQPMCAPCNVEKGSR